MDNMDCHLLRIHLATQKTTDVSKMSAVNTISAHFVETGRPVIASLDDMPGMPATARRARRDTNDLLVHGS
jgi:hypothetical protein